MNKKILIALTMMSLVIVGMMPTVVQAQQVEITFWFTENASEAPGVLDLIAQFEASNPDIKVNCPCAKGFFSAKENYLTQFSAKGEPTVFRAARDWVVEFAQQGLIQPVTAYMNETSKADFLENALRLVTYPDGDGAEQIWGFPHLVDGPALFYNVYLLEQAGINTTKYGPDYSMTWGEFEEVVQQIWDHDFGRESGSEGEPVYGFTVQGMFFGAQPAYFGHGGRFFANETVSYDNIIIDSNESRDGLEFIKKVVDAEYSPTWEEQGWETINPLFMNGHVGMVQQGPWEIKNFLDNSREFNSGAAQARSYASPDNLGIMRLPHDENGNEGAPLGGHAYVVSSRATGAVKEAAMKFAQFLSDKHALSEGAIDYYHVPVRQSVFDNPAVQDSPGYKFIETFENIIANSIKVPVDHRWAQLETIFGNELDNYLADESTLNEFLAFVSSFWAEILVEGGAAAIGSGAAASDTSTEPFDNYAFLLALIALPLFVYRRKD